MLRDELQRYSRCGTKGRYKSWVYKVDKQAEKWTGLGNDERNEKFIEELQEMTCRIVVVTVETPGFCRH